MTPSEKRIKKLVMETDYLSNEIQRLGEKSEKLEAEVKYIVENDETSEKDYLLMTMRNNMTAIRTEFIAIRNEKTAKDSEVRELMQVCMHSPFK
jgi:hypothetical protein